ncbi:hypothetical protein [Nostoc sp. WHI]|uniref:hypothetical protein n=1 Tax=Nostoc sp. WHI TaxID=2650611 RepID=UPI0018C6B063|nr:hypothetical protein [Nostoc sp. WHI]MBG1265247.1 hypothetical protein [Nostoc sp. WHI]
MSEQAKTILSYMYEKLEKDNFINFLIDNYDSDQNSNDLLSYIYDEHDEFINFESFVDLSIKVLKPDWDGKVYVKYSTCYTAHDDGDEIVVPLNQSLERIELRNVSKFLSQHDGQSLGIDLDDQEEKELVFSILNDGYYELPDRDIYENSVEISIKELEITHPYYDQDDELD